MTVKRPADTATKAKLLEAFDELSGEYGELQKQFKGLQQELKNLQSAPKQALQKEVSPPVVEVRPAKMVSKDQNKMEFTLGLLEQLQAGISSTLAELSEKLSVEAKKLEDLGKVTTQERKALAELYELTLTDDTLDQLLVEYEETAKTSKEEYSVRKETLDQALLELSRAWEEAQEAHNKAILDRNTTAALAQKRENEEYTYALKLARKLDEEQYQAQKLELDKARSAREEVQEKAWMQQEKALDEVETRHFVAEQKVAGMAAEKESAVKKAEAEGTGIGNKQARIKADLLGKEIEGQRRIYEQRIAAVQMRVESQNNRISVLSKQLESASKQIQDLAARAIEGTANSNALTAFKDLAMEQAKSQGKTKS